MAEATATLEAPDTADAPEAPPAETLPETSIAEQSPETGDAPGVPETDDQPDSPFAGLDPDAIKADSKVAAIIEAERKAAEASARESERRKFEAQQQDANERVAQQQYQQRLQAATQQAQQGLAGAFLGEAQAAARKFEKGEAETAELSPQRVTQFLAAAHQNGSITVTQALADRAAAWLNDPNCFGGVNPPAELVRTFEQAKAQLRPDLMLDAWSNIAEAVVTQKRQADYLAGVPDDVLAEHPRVKAFMAKVASGELRVEGVKAAVAGRAARPGPTNVAGAGSARSAFNPKTQQDVDGALFRGEIDSATARAWLTKGLPYSA